MEEIIVGNLSLETLHVLMSYSAKVSISINEVSENFQVDYERMHLLQDDLNKNINILRDSLDGKSKDIFESILNTYKNHIIENDKSVMQIANLIRENMGFTNEVIEEIQRR